MLIFTLNSVEREISFYCYNCDSPDVLCAVRCTAKVKCMVPAGFSDRVILSDFNSQPFILRALRQDKEVMTFGIKS